MKGFSVLFLLCLCPLFTFASFGKIDFLTVKDGLANNTIYDIYSKKGEFLWISTDLGISRYDGFHIRNFPLISPQTDLLQAAYCGVRKIAAGSDELLFLLLTRGGLVCFDKRTERYLPVEFNIHLKSTRITSLYVTEENGLYLGTTHGLYTGTAARAADKVTCSLLPKPLLKGGVSTFCLDGKGRLYVCVDAKKVYCYDTATRKKQLLDVPGDIIAPVRALQVLGNYLWICHSQPAITCYQLNKKTFRTFMNAADPPVYDFKGTSASGIACVNDTTYYLSTWAGLYRLNFRSKEIEKADYTLTCVSQEERRIHIGMVNEMTCLLWDPEQNLLWAGSFGGGVLKMDLQKKVYSRLALTMNAGAREVEEDLHGYVWISTYRGVYRSTTNTFSTATRFEPWLQGGMEATTYKMYKDPHGNLWFGDRQGGIFCVESITGRMQTFRVPARIRRFCLDASDVLWIVTSKGLYRLNYKTTMRSRRVNVLTPGVKEINAVAQDKDGMLWAGTDAGLKRMEQQGEHVTFSGDYEQQTQQQVEPVRRIYVNSNNQIFAAYASRLIQIDGRNKEKVETSYSLMDGLASGRIYCLVDDQNGNTWVGGNSDIMTLRNHKKELYDRYLPGSYNHVCRLQDGRLLWADSDELLFFDPVNLKHRLHKDKLQIADLHINGSSVPLNGNKSGPLVLEAQDNDFCLFFTDLQFESLQRKMLYRLQPDEKEWKMGTMGEGIDYRHLPSGEYTLQVKQVYLDGSEGEVLEIAVKVKKHCWFTYGAFLGYLLVMGLMSWGTYLHVRQRAKRKEVQREREAKLNEIMTVVKMKEIKTQEVENMRNELLTMMVQKLRSPITLIIAPLKELLQEADQMSGRLSDKILVAYRNAIGMLDSCNQLFDIYAQGFPSNELNLSSYSVDALLDSVVHDISELMRVYRIDFRYEKKQNKETAIWVDKKKISIVLHNLLSNALNHTRFSGIIGLTAQETVKDGKRYGMFTVTDNGTEWIKEWKKQANAGDQVDLSSVVFGFSVMQKLVKHHHGSLQIEMEEESGTKAIIYLPLDKGVYDADAHVHFVYVIDSAQENLLKKKAEDRAALVHVLPPLLTEESAPVARGKKKILVVDDHKDIRLYLKVLLGIEYNVVFAINGKEGVSLAKSELPDLILCDVMMPIMDGFECCRLLKEGLDTCHIPLVMLTAKVEDDDIIKGLELGADDYMLKPFTPSILKAKIKNLINGRVYLKQLYTKLLMLPGEDQASVTTDSKEQAGFKEDPFIASVIRIVEENLCEMDFSVKKLAESLSMSQPTLYRKVKQSTDFTIVELIRGVRMRKAAKLLKQKTHTVQEVVEMVGYNDIPTFRKHFVDAFGTNPSTYADMHAEKKD